LALLSTALIGLRGRTRTHGHVPMATMSVRPADKNLNYGAPPCRVVGEIGSRTVPSRRGCPKRPRIIREVPSGKRGTSRGVASLVVPFRDTLRKTDHPDYSVRVPFPKCEDDSSHAPQREVRGSTWVHGSGLYLRAAEPFVETMRRGAFTQRHERELLPNPAAKYRASGSYDLRGVDGLQIEGNDSLETRLVQRPYRRETFKAIYRLRLAKERM